MKVIHTILQDEDWVKETAYGTFQNLNHYADYCAKKFYEAQEDEEVPSVMDFGEESSYCVTRGKQLVDDPVLFI